MTQDIVIEPTTEKSILWRCLHDGPVSIDTPDQWRSEKGIPVERYRDRNTEFLRKLTKVYGACAIVARDGNEIVGQLRFYPKSISDMVDGSLCLQQDHPAGPADDFAGTDFPALDELTDKTLSIHCLMTGTALQAQNPYQRKGIGARMVKSLIQWAKANGWSRIEVDSFEDLPIIYETTGSAGYSFWEKLGFHIADRHPHPHLQDPEIRASEFVKTLEEQAKSAGIHPDKARDRLIMRLDLVTESI